MTARLCNDRGMNNPPRFRGLVGVLAAVLLAGCMTMTVEIVVPPSESSSDGSPDTGSPDTDSTGLTFSGTVGDMYPVVTVHATGLDTGPMTPPPFKHEVKIWGKVVSSCSDDVYEIPVNLIYHATENVSMTRRSTWSIAETFEGITVAPGEIFKIKVWIRANSSPNVWESTACTTNGS